MEHRFGGRANSRDGGTSGVGYGQDIYDCCYRVYYMLSNDLLLTICLFCLFGL